MALNVSTMEAAVWSINFWARPNLQNNTGTQLSLYRTETETDPQRCVCGSGPGFVSFWASRIRIRHYLYGSGPGSGSFQDQAKKVIKTVIFTVFFYIFDINVFLQRDSVLPTCSVPDPDPVDPYGN